MNNRNLTILTGLGIAAVCLACLRNVRVEMDNRHFALEIGSNARQPAPEPMMLTTVAPGGRIHRLNAVCDSDSELRLLSVIHSDTTTSMQLRFTGDVDGEFGGARSISTGAPGQLTSFFVQDAETDREFKLLNVDGLSLDPVRTVVRDGRSVEFSLTFERIPDSVTRFHLIEGKIQPPDQNGNPLIYWVFSNVNLR
jgi:hypothetical protein